MNFIIKTLQSSLMISLIFSINLFAQNQDLQALSQQVSVFYEQGKFDEAVPLAEKILQIERQNKSTNSRNLINAIENLSQIKLGRFKQLRQKLAENELDKSKAEKITGVINKDGKDIEDYIREALILSAQESKKDQLQIISLRNELSWLLYNYFPPSPELNIGVSKEERDRFESVSRIKFQTRIDEAGNLYSQTLKESETIFGDENDITLVTAYNFAEFDLVTGNFEKALPLYEKCIKIIEKKYSPESRNLILPLQSYAKILVATNQNEAAIDAAKRLQKITGKSADMSKVLLNLSLRADKSFAATNAPSVESQARSNESLVALGRRSATVGGGSSNPDTYSQILSGSTSGKSYYENYRQMKLINITVRVLVDEKGKVVETEALTKDKSFKTAAEKVVKDWTFRSFSFNGQAHKLSGYVECLFFSN